MFCLGWLSHFVEKHFGKLSSYFLQGGKLLPYSQDMIIENRPRAKKEQFHRPIQFPLFAVLNVDLQSAKLT